MKPTKPGSYQMNGRPCLVGLHKGTLVACWIDDKGEFQKARVWANELKDAKWASTESTE